MADSVDINPRVGVVGPDSPPAGGMAAQTQQLCRLLAEEGVKVEYLQTNAPYQPAWISGLVGIRAIFRLLSYLISAWKFLGRVDVVHLMSNSGWSWQLFSAPVIWLSRFKGLPVVVNYRGGEAADYLSRSVFWVRPSLSRASVLVVPSRYLKDVFSQYHFASEVIPNIIDAERFYPAVKQSKSDKKTLEIVIARNLEAIYDVETAIRSVHRFRQLNPSVHLSIAGSGPEEGRLKQLVEKLDLEDSVSFLGRLNRQQVADLYRQADVLLNTSRVDNMPNSLLEAMASEVAIVSTRAGGIPWMVEDEKTALLTEIGDDKAIAEALLRLSREPCLRQKLVKQGLAEVKQYHWIQVKSQWLSLYRQLLSNKLIKASEQRL